MESARMVSARLVSLAGATAAGLLDLVLPADCAGCAAPGTWSGVCADCLIELDREPGPARPTPAPPGLPPCFAAAEYAGVVRELILAYKERDRRLLAGPLGDALARVVLAAWPVRAADSPLALVAVPSTAAAIRARHGDHMLRLARRAARTLCREGCPAVVARPLRALPKRDSAHLDRQQRAATAKHAFELRSGRAESLRVLVDRGAVVVLDDIVTTGSTLAAVSRELLSVGVPVAFGVTLAATRLRQGGKLYGTPRDLGVD